MPLLISILATCVLVTGFVYPHWCSLVAVPTGVTVLVGGSVGASAIVGLWWFKGLKHLKGIDQHTECSAIVDRFFRENLLWLQGARPISTVSRLVPDEDPAAAMTMLSTRFMSSYLLAIGLVALGGIVMIATNSFNLERGLFGSLLRTQFGKGISLGLMLYLSISSLAFFFVGLLAFLFKGGNSR